jgi:hypothetical protein
VRFTKRTLRARNNRLPVTITCSEACAGELFVERRSKGKVVRLAYAKFVLGGNIKTTLQLKLTKEGIRFLKAANRTTKLRFRAAARDASGNRGSDSTRMRVRSMRRGVTK